MNEPIELEIKCGGYGQHRSISTTISFDPLYKLLIISNILAVEFEVQEIEND